MMSPSSEPSQHNTLLSLICKTHTAGQQPAVHRVPAPLEQAAVGAEGRSALQVIRAVKTRPLYALPFLQPGRLIRVTDGADEWG